MPQHRKGVKNRNIMTVCLVLLTGLPGAGKTTLGKALKQLGDHITHELSLIVTAVVELDDFMCNVGASNGSRVESTVFDPSRWREAFEAARQATRQELERCLMMERNKAVMHLVFLVDPLPYRSMRASYWKMCKELSAKCAETHFHDSWEVQSIVVLLEVRMNTPEEVCLQRNELRAGTPQYIPPYVIKGISDSFDRGDLTAVLLGTDGNMWAVLPGQKSAPWPVLLLVDEVRCCASPPNLLATQLLERIRGEDIMREMTEQQVSVFNYYKCQVEGGKSKCLASGEAHDNVNNCLHQVDLHMRAVVGHYMVERQSSGSLKPGTGQRVSKCRSTHYAGIRAAITKGTRNTGGSFSEVQGLLQQLLLEFEHALVDL